MEHCMISTSECLSKEIKIGLLIWHSTQKLPFDMGFKNISRNLVPRFVPRGHSYSKSIFVSYKWPVFSHTLLQSTSMMLFHILLERSTKTDVNGI